MQLTCMPEMWLDDERRAVPRVILEEPQMDEKTDSGEETIIAVTSTGQEMDSPMDPRFGRCTFFAIIDPSGNMKPAANGAQSFWNGAGIEAAKQVADLKVGTVITGNVGPNAFRVLAAAGIKVFVGGSGTVREALENYRRGSLTQTSASTSPGHHGMGGRRRGNRP